MSTARVTKKVSKKKDYSHLIVLTIGLALCAFSVALAFSTLPSQVSAFNFNHHENEHDNQTLAQLCSNGIDDDDDGYIDLLDSDCAQYIPLCSADQHADETLHCVNNQPEDPVCAAPQQLVNHVCTDPQPPQDPDCIAPEVLVNHECIAPTIVVCAEGTHHPDGDSVSCVPDVVTPPTCTETQHLSENVCVDNEITPPADQVPPPSFSDAGNPECSDGIDNDNDGRVDYPHDASCADAGDNSEGNDGGGFFGGSGGNGAAQSGLVLGASTDLPNGCTALLSGYLKMGVHNDPAAVKTLQEFLNADLGTSLVIDGIFGQSTFNAVAQFQKKYSDDVLVPWLKYGLKSKDNGTGYVYKTTLRKINLLHCASLDIPMPQLP